MPQTQRTVRSRHQSHRTSSTSRTEPEMYFSEIDVNAKTNDPNYR